MKTLLKSLLFAVIAALGVPAFAAPENHEEFARQYMPKSQAILERFRKDCAETQKLRESLAEDLRVMGRDLGDDACYWALSEKIVELKTRESRWANRLKDAFFRHKAGIVTPEKLSEADAELAKKYISWENNVLKNLIINTAAMFGVPATIQIPGKNYAIGKYEVTQAQYGLVMGKNPSHFKGGNLPVECVSWDEAVEFCKKLTKRERLLGRISENQEYRLPSNEEWAYACSAKTAEFDVLRETEENLAKIGWFHGRYNGGCTHAVGGKVPNGFGLYDMYGNVWEWTSTSNKTEANSMGGGWTNFVHDYNNVHPCWVERDWKSKCHSALGFRVVLSEVQ